MLSIETLPMRPVKKSSSVMLELMSLRAGRRTRILANLEERAGIREMESQSRPAPNKPTSTRLLLLK